MTDIDRKIDSNDNGEVQETSEEFHTRMTAALGLGGVDSAVPEVTRSTASSEVHRVGERLERKPWATEVPDAAETAAWAALVALRDQVNETVEAIWDLPAQQRASEAAYENAVAAATREGRPLPRKPKKGDWEWSARELLGRYRGLKALYEEARSTHAKAQKAATETQAQILVADLDARRAAAVEALQSPALAAAAQAVNSYTDALHLAGEALHEAGRNVPVVRRRRESPSAFQIPQAVADALAALTGVDPYYTGSYLHMSDGFEPSRYEREQMFQSGAGALLQLQWLEVNEDYRHTAFTRELNRQQFKTLPTDGSGYLA